MKIFFCIFAIILVCFMATSCQKKQEEQPQTNSAIVIGYSQIGDESAWRTYLTSSIKKAATENGIQLIFENAEQKQENQLKAIRSFIAYQVDLIAFSPIVETGWDNVLEEAKTAGIPVILVDRQIEVKDNSLYECYIGSDFETEGLKAANFLLEKLKNTTDDVAIVELRGTDNSTPAIGRSKGFRNGLKNHSNFNIIHSENADFMRSKGAEAMKEILKKYDKVDVLYSHNDPMTLGAIDAMKEMGFKPGEDIIIITIDGEQAAIDRLEAGEINCVIECSPNLGQTIVKTAKQYLLGESISRNIYTEEEVFTEWDLSSEILPRGY